MTDTTDIKALREALCKLKSVEGLRTLAVGLIHKLEVERQRADDNSAECQRQSSKVGRIKHDLQISRQRAETAEARVGVLEGIMARKEFDALKGKQAIVGFTSESALNDVADGDLKVGYQLSHADSAMLKRVAEVLIAIREAHGVQMGFISESTLDDVAD